MRGICALENPDQAVLDRIIAKLLIPTVDGTVATTSTATVDPDTGAAVAANTPNGKLVTIGSRRFPGAALRAERATTGVFGALSTSTRLSSNTTSAAEYPSVRTLVEDNTASNSHLATSAAVAITDGVNYVISGYAAQGPGSNRGILLLLTGVGNSAGTYVNLQTGALLNYTAGNGVVVRSSARLLPTGYWFFQVTVSSAAWGGTVALQSYMTNGGAFTYSGDGVSGVKISGYQCELGDSPTMPLAWDGSAGVSRIAQLNSWNQSLDTSVGAVYARVLPYARSGAIGTTAPRLYQGTLGNGRMFYNNNTGAWGTQRIDSLAAGYGGTTAVLPPVAGAQQAITHRWDATNSRATINGVTTGLGGMTLPWAADTSMVIGNLAALTDPFEGHVFLALTRPGLTLTDTDIAYLDRYVRIN